MSAEVKEQRLLLELVGDARGPVELPRQGVMTIGSSKDKADLHIDGQGVADVHCAVGRIKSGGWALKDLGSEYGTMINGEKVQSRKLEAGDFLLIGSRRLRVLDRDTPSAAQRSAAPKVAEPSSAQTSPAPPAASTAPRVSSEAKPSVAAPTNAVPATSDKPAATANLASTRFQDTAKLPQVKGYRVERQLGRGGMGEVYLAVQESLGRPVALKVLASKLAADSDFVKRFQSEARAAAALNHPNVVTVHDVWEDNGQHLLAMEFMDRGNLEQRLARDGKLGARECLDIMSDAAKALVYAELRGIVHRDIKPANLMQNSVGTTKLADLGLAMHLEAEATESDNKKIYGTPHFISPEQARGEKVDIRSDMYSLGATMYRLISGRTPFEGNTTREILRGHFLDAPPALATLVPDVSPGLTALVHRLLEKKPDARFPSAATLLTEIERLRSEAIVGSSAVAAAPTSKSNVGMIVGVGVVIALAVGGYFLFGGNDKPSVVPPVPVEPKTSQPEQPGTAPDRPETQPARDATEVPVPVRPRDDDRALKERETEAENALQRLPKDLSNAERILELRSLAERFAGTVAATRALEQAEQLARDAQSAAATTSAQLLASSQWLESVRLAGYVDGVPKPLSEALRAMLAEAVPAELAADAEVPLKRRELFATAVRNALVAARQDWQAADELAKQGKFDELETRLKPWVSALDLPPMPEELGFEALPDLNEVINVHVAIRNRLESLPAARAESALALERADRAKVAEFLRGDSGVGRALRNLDFDAARQRLAGLEQSLATEAARGFARELSAGLDAGRATLLTMSAEFTRGGWKRAKMTDPRTKSRAARDVIGANQQGLLIKGDSDSELIPWSAFSLRTVDLHQLFHQRLQREYTSEELRGIDALLRCSAVLLLIEETADMFAPNSTAVLSDEEARGIFEAFDVARPWAVLAGTTEQFDRETEAARVLSQALRSMTAGAWSRATASFERLRMEFDDTLVVRLISDGRTL